MKPFELEPEELTEPVRRKIEDVLQAHAFDKTDLVSILLDVEAEMERHYISRAVAYYVADRLGLRPTQAYDVISFYTALHDRPRAKFPLQICDSAPCRVNGSESLYDMLRAVLGIDLGEVTYDGASSFQALVEAAAEKFMDANPDVSISGSGNGSGKGLTAVAAGTVTIGNSDVFAETKLEADQVKNLVDHEVAVVGMGPVVSKNVKVDDLSLEQLKGIFSGQITNWKEVGGDDAKIVVLNRKAGSGTRATFEAAVFGDEAVDFKGDAELDKSGDVQTQMGSTDNAISYLDFSHFDDSKFNAIKVEGVEPKSTNVTDDSFKIWATEHMYCAKDADEATKAFLEFMLSDDVQGKLVEEQGFIPVSAMKVVKDASGKVSAK